MKVWILACFIFTPAAIPPNPAPTITVLGVPAEPNICSAVGFTDICLTRTYHAHVRGFQNIPIVA